MEGLMLLERARAAGLVVARDGDQLVVQGPASEEPLATALIQAKPHVLAALSVAETLALDRPWQETPIRTCRGVLEGAGETIRAFAESRWGSEAADWSPEMLAGFYVRDLLGGLRATFGEWTGWEKVQERLDRQRGPTAIARLWCAYSKLPPDTRQEVLERGDRTTSPPDCLAVGGHA